MKRTLFSSLLGHRKTVIAVFAVLLVVCAACYPFVRVDYEMSDYLPPDTASSTALDVMGAEFEGAIPNAQVMVTDVSIPQALELKEIIASVEGVDSVTWLDDVVDMTVPLAMQDKETVETYFKDGNALFSVAIQDDSYLSAVPAIREVAGENACLTGAAVSTELATSSTVSQIAIIGICAVLFIVFILLLTTTSWFTPIVVLIGLGVAIIINAGSNIIFGTISFVTNAAGNVLQLAIALDFSVFLLHRYRECRGKYGSAQQDMLEALCQSSTAILSSGLTVTIGFLALCAMRFQIGPDLGLALAKGILISIVTVFSLTPVLFIVFDRQITRFEHKSIIPDLSGLGRAVLKVCVPVACVYLCFTIPAFLASTSDDINMYYGASHIFGDGTSYGDQTRTIEDAFGQNDTYVLMVPNGNTSSEAALASDIKEVQQVKSVISYTETAGRYIPRAMVDPSQLSKLQSDSYNRLVIAVDAAAEGEDTFALVEGIRAIAQQHYPDEWLLAGAGVSTTDLMQTITQDKVIVDVVAVVAVFLVLLLALRSLSLPVILVLVIETSIWINFSIPYVTGAYEFFISYLIASVIQLGVTVDYAILCADRYKELRREQGKRESIVEMIRTCTVPVLTSGTVLVVVGFIMGRVSTHGILAQLGTFLAIGCSISLVAVIFALPGLLYLLDGVIAKTTWHACFLPDKRRANKC